MAMMLGSSKGPSAELNVTPMIDILLVLIIIFMLLPHHVKGEKAAIPQPAITGQKQTERQDTVVLQIRTAPEGAVLLLNQEPVSWESLQLRLREIYSSRPTQVLFIKGDSGLAFDVVAQAIDRAHAAVPELMIALLTSPIAGETRHQP